MLREHNCLTQQCKMWGWWWYRGTLLTSSSCSIPSRRKATKYDLRESMNFVSTPEDCVAVLNHATQTCTGTDDLLRLLTKAYMLQLPTEHELQRLSVCQQQTARLHNDAEYACLTLWVCALEAIMHTERVLKGSQSVPCIGSVRSCPLKRSYSV